MYQGIQRLRKYGAVPRGFTPTGLPAREVPQDIVMLTGADGDTQFALLAVQELRRTRDDLDTIVRRLSTLFPR